MFTIQKELAGLYPGAFNGILIMRDVLNIPAHEKLDLVKRGIENSIREKIRQNVPQSVKVASSDGYLHCLL